ncbi:DNA primase [Streptomyces cadmiisoli]|uniref:DNA primase n=1 Tax=Streptomyces cadmiisoli TaxID=2184053 RepID=UPI0013A6DC92|nr:DNA primase [Streptomyces cadmiisoli]
MNRVGLGLAVGAGYVLGRTRKLRLAFAVGTLVAGRRMQLSPRALAELVSGQLANNPQFKEIGDQLRQDLRGVGGAATGALVERQLDTLADRLHDRTAGVRDRLGGVVPGQADGRYDDEDRLDHADEDRQRRYGDDQPGTAERDAGAERESARSEPGRSAPGRAAPAKKAVAKKAAVKKAPAKKAAGQAPGGKAPAKKKTAAERTAARRTASARAASAGTASAKTAARRTTPARASGRTPKGGDER